MARSPRVLGQAFAVGRAVRRWSKPLLGLVAVTLLLWWVFRDIELAELWQSLSGADAWLLSISAAIALGGFGVRAIRWRFLLAPVQPLTPIASRFAALAVGFMANNLLPSGRVGEVGRAYVYSRMEPVRMATVFATLIVERLLDAVAIMGLLLVAVSSPGFPSADLPTELLLGMRAVMGLVAIILAMCVLLVSMPERSVRAFNWVLRRILPPRLGRGATRILEELVAGLGSMRGWRLMAPALLWSVALWCLQSLSFWVGFLAFGIKLPFAAALVTNAAVAMAVSVPAAPGYIGTFQAGVSLALVVVYGVAEAPALGFAVGWHLVNFVPITALGLWYCRHLGLRWKDLRGKTSTTSPPDGTLASVP